MFVIFFTDYEQSQVMKVLQLAKRVVCTKETSLQLIQRLIDYNDRFSFTLIFAALSVLFLNVFSLYNDPESVFIVAQSVFFGRQN